MLDGAAFEQHDARLAVADGKGKASHHDFGRWQIRIFGCHLLERFHRVASVAFDKRINDCGKLFLSGRTFFDATWNQNGDRLFDVFQRLLGASGLIGRGFKAAGRTGLIRRVFYLA